MSEATPELRATAFGATLCELLEEREIEATPESVSEIAQNAGLDGDRLIERMSDTTERPFDLENLTYLARHLELSDEEMMDLALSYTYQEPSVVLKCGFPVYGEPQDL
jgi:hypothetical protein